MPSAPAGASLDALVARALADHKSGRIVEAASAYQQVLAAAPDHVDALHLLGLIARDHGHLDAALSLIGRAVERDPSFAEAQNNLGTVAKAKGELPGAMQRFQAAIALQPSYAVAQNNLGNGWMDLGDRRLAASHLRRALAIEGSYAEAHGNLANALQMAGRLEAALAGYRRALSLMPASGEAWSNLASLAQALAEAEIAERRFRRALAIKPEPWLHSNLLFAMCYDPAASSERLFEEYRRWEKGHARQSDGRKPPATRDRDRRRKLRLGYVSADFRAHPVGWNVLGLIEAHDRDRWQVCCYGDVLRPDPLTERFMRLADLWRPVTGLGDEALAEVMRKDRIDILVVLAGHTGRNRVRVAAFRPAPLQVSFHDLSTSGLAEMDGWITDGILHPAGTRERFTERLIRLPCFYLHRAPEPTPDPGPPPEAGNGFLTFGSCNNTAKLNPQVLALWAEILNRVPGSKLLLKYLDRFRPGILRARIVERLARHGIGADRLVFLDGDVGRDDQLEVLDRVDVALDPFPFNGSTTTFEALWMGVPVVTLAGERFLGRVGASVLPHVDLGDLVAADEAGYVRAAVALAGNRERRHRLRRELRARLQASSLMDAQGYARTVEAALLELWQTGPLG